MRQADFSFAQTQKRAELCGKGGRLRLLAVFHPPNNTRKILDCLSLPSRPFPIAPARRDDQEFDPFRS